MRTGTRFCGPCSTATRLPSEAEYPAVHPEHWVGQTGRQRLETVSGALGRQPRPQHQWGSQGREQHPGDGEQTQHQGELGQPPEVLAPAAHWTVAVQLLSCRSRIRASAAVMAEVKGLTKNLRRCSGPVGERPAGCSVFPSGHRCRWHLQAVVVRGWWVGIGGLAQVACRYGAVWAALRSLGRDSGNLMGSCGQLMTTACGQPWGSLGGEPRQKSMPGADRARRRVWWFTVGCFAGSRGLSGSRS